MMSVGSCKLAPGSSATVLIVLANGSIGGCPARLLTPCPVRELLAEQKFSTWVFQINPNEAEIFYA